MTFNYNMYVLHRNRQETKKNGVKSPEDITVTVMLILIFNHPLQRTGSDSLLWWHSRFDPSGFNHACGT